MQATQMLLCLFYGPHQNYLRSADFCPFVQYPQLADLVGSVLVKPLP